MSLDSNRQGIPTKGGLTYHRFSCAKSCKNCAVEWALSPVQSLNFDPFANWSDTFQGSCLVEFAHY
jgi:hypothetical protein